MFQRRDLVFDLLKYRSWNDLPLELRQNTIAFATQTMYFKIYQNSIHDEDVWTLEIRPLNKAYIDNFVSRMMQLLMQNMQNYDEQNITHLNLRFTPPKNENHTKTWRRFN